MNRSTLVTEDLEVVSHPFIGSIIRKPIGKKMDSFEIQGGAKVGLQL